MGKKDKKDKDRDRDRAGEADVFLQTKTTSPIPMRTKDSNSDAFGDVLYELKEESPAGGLYKRKYRCCFYEKVVLIQDEEHFLCYPTSYSQEVHLKYKLTGVEISKAKVPRWLFYLACGMLIVGIALIVIGEENSKSEDAEEKEQGEILLYVGIALMVLALIIYILPFLFVEYFTTFTFASVPQEDNMASLCRDLLNRIFNFDEQRKGSFVVRSTSQPDQDFLFAYVYGCMGTKMPEFHAFSHLASDGLSGRFEPNSLMDLEAMQ